MGYERARIIRFSVRQLGKPGASGEYRALITVYNVEDHPLVYAAARSWYKTLRPGQQRASVNRSYWMMAVKNFPPEQPMKILVEMQGSELLRPYPLALLDCYPRQQSTAVVVPWAHNL